MLRGCEEGGVSERMFKHSECDSVWKVCKAVGKCSKKNETKQRELAKIVKDLLKRNETREKLCFEPKFPFFFIIISKLYMSHINFAYYYHPVFRFMLTWQRSISLQPEPFIHSSRNLWTFFFLVFLGENFSFMFPKLPLFWAFCVNIIILLLFLWLVFSVFPPWTFLSSSFIHLYTQLDSRLTLLSLRIRKQSEGVWFSLHEIYAKHRSP